MKHLLLLCLLLSAAAPARAQLTAAGILVGRALTSERLPPQSQTEYVAQRSYQSQWYACKRTPPARLPRKGERQIVAMERFLDERQKAMLTDPIGTVVDEARYAKYQALQQAIGKACPAWNLQPYDAELSFYQGGDIRRQAGK